MCTYNGAKYLKEQLDSIINQTYPIYELIIQDDCSTDETTSILKEYAQRYSFIHYRINEKNKGYNLNFFSAIALAKGDYIAISDQDDIWERNKIELQINSIGDAWLSSGFSKPFANDSSIKIYFNDKKPNCTLERMMYIGMTPGHTLLIKKELIDKIPNLNRWAQYYTYDKTLQMVAAAYEKVQFCDAVLVHQRRHVSAATYGPAENYKRNLSNIINSVKRTYRLYKELKPFMREYFKNTYQFISAIQANTESKKNAEKMALLQSQHGIVAYIKLTLLCIKLQNRIFYSVENNKLFSTLRAIYFPISCSDYFRYKSKFYSKGK